MIDQNLLAYVRNALAQGVDSATITQALLAAGWQATDVSAAINFATASNPDVPPASVTSSSLQEQYPLSPRKFWKKILAQTIPLVILGIFIAMFTVFAMDLFSPASTNPFNDLLPTASVDSLIFFSVAMFIYAWYVKVYIRRYYYDATGNYITIKKGVFAPAEIHVQYTKIQDVYVDQDILDRIMGLYDVHLASATAASGIEAHIDGVDAVGAEGLKGFLLQKLGSSTSASPVQGTSINAPVKISAAFANDISDKSYPITGMWFVQQAIVGLYFSSLILIVLLRLNLSLMLFIMIFVIAYILRIGYSVLWRSNYSFNFLPDYIVTKQGVFAKNETHLPYRAIQDVSVSQGMIERMLGIATVRIEDAAVQTVGRSTSSSAIIIPGQPLSKANEISDAVKRVALTRDASQTGL